MKPVFDDAVKAVLGQMMEEVGVETDPSSLALALKEVRALIAELRTLATEIEQRYTEVAGEKVLEVPGVGVVEIKRATTRTAWEHDELWKRVAARALDEREADPDTGEWEREADTVARVLRECATPSWKVLGLRAHGIDPDEFCHTEYGKPSVMIVGS